MPTGVEDSPDLVVLSVDYEPGTPDPGRVFRSLAQLIQSFEQVDRDLAAAVSVRIRAEVLLERVESGSVKAILRTVLEQIDDEALRDLNWRPLIGQYLVKSKHAILRWMEGRESVGSRVEVIDLQDSIRNLAPRLSNELLPPGAVPLRRLLTDVSAIAAAAQELGSADSASLISAFGETAVEKRLVLTADDVTTLLTDRTRVSETTLTLLVKRPDYLGNSRWEFKDGERPLEARVSDSDWLVRFQHGEVLLKPGDALRAVVRTELAMAPDGSVVDFRHELVKVVGVVDVSDPVQGGLLREQDDD